MLAAFLISLREAVEAILIVATLWGVTSKLELRHLRKQLLIGTLSAVVVSAAIMLIGTFLGIQLGELYQGKAEEIIEGVLMISSAGFITWAVIYLHNAFTPNKIKFISKLKNKDTQIGGNTMFWLAFVSVFREGVELAIFTQSLYFSSSIAAIYLGVLSGTTIAVLLCAAIIKSIIRFPIYRIFQITTALLILFSAGLLARGIHELAEAHIVPEVITLVFPLIPSKETTIGQILKITFGITQKMDLLQVISYGIYSGVMSWFFLIKPSSPSR